jgi:polyamine oxidase
VLSLKLISFPFLTISSFLFVNYVLFDKDGQEVPEEIIRKVGETFERILKEVLQSLALTWFLTVKVRDEHANDVPLIQAMANVPGRNPHMK